MKMLQFLAKYRVLHLTIGALLALFVLAAPRAVVAVIFVIVGSLLGPAIDHETELPEFTNKWAAAGATFLGGAGVVFLFYVIHRL
jgi:uncharacterized membrane protein